MNEITLNSFASFFELFCGYYLLLGISVKLQEYLDITSWLDINIPKNYATIMDSEMDYFYSERLRLRNKNLDVVRMKHESCIRDPLTDNFVCHIERTPRFLVQKIKDIWVRLKLPFRVFCYKVLLRRISWVYEKKEKGSGNVPVCDTKFYKIILPMYLFFGVVALTMLILMGLESKFDIGYNLQFVNCVSLLVFLVKMFQLLILRIKNKLLTFFNKPIVLINSLIVSVFAIFFPFSRFDQYYRSIDFSMSVNLKEIQVLMVIIFIITPVILHLVLLLELILFSNRVKKDRRINTLKVGNSITDITQPKGK